MQIGNHLVSILPRRLKKLFPDLDIKKYIWAGYLIQLFVKETKRILILFNEVGRSLNILFWIQILTAGNNSMPLWMDLCKKLTRFFGFWLTRICKNSMQEALGFGYQRMNNIANFHIELMESLLLTTNETNGQLCEWF